jgi:hypothetical protein
MDENKKKKKILPNYKERKYNIPIKIEPDSTDLENIIGENKGIQGETNSCYLDTLLMAMFSFTNVFDYLLYRKKEAKDIKQYEMIQQMLEKGIVESLRK